MTKSPGAATDAELATARRLFAQECTFVRGVARLPDLPLPVLPEVAFAGRSNVGKSSLLNALTNRKTLARTSNTPGRTRELNFFDLAGRLMLVDLPGYGYARASKSDIARWNTTLRDYLRGRPNLHRLSLLVDSRRGIKDGDREMMAMLDASAVVYRVILTKADKPKSAELASLVEAVTAEMRNHPAALPKPIVTSARKSIGIGALQADLALLAKVD